MDVKSVRLKGESMLIVIFSLFVLVIGIAFLLYDDMSIIGLCLVVVSSVILVSSLVAIPKTIMDGKNNLISYEIDKQIIQRVFSLENPGTTEISEAINIARTDNEIIMRTRMWRDNKLINWFYYYPVGDLELFDISKIQNSNQKITIDEESK